VSTGFDALLPVEIAEKAEAVGVAKTRLDTLSLLALAVLAGIVLLTTRSLALFKTDQIGRHLLRNVIHFLAQYAWLMGLTLIPLAQLFALEFTAPLWVALLAPLILKEKLTPVRLVAATFGFLGALVVIKPASTALSEGSAYALAAAEVVAASRDGDMDRLPKDAIASVKENAAKINAAALLAPARKAVMRVLKNSELTEQWADTPDHEDWEDDVRELLERLKG